MDASANPNDARIQELAELVLQIRAQVLSAHPGPGSGGLRLADLMPAIHARDAAEGKVAAIGWVNPRPPGFVNGLIQGVKRGIARSLGWFVREQVEFNRGLLRCVDALVEAQNESNRAQVELAARIGQLTSTLTPPLDRIEAALRELAVIDQQIRDLAAYASNWRTQWESRLDRIELEWRRAAAEQQQTLLRRVEAVEANTGARLTEQQQTLLRRAASVESVVAARLSAVEAEWKAEHTGASDELKQRHAALQEALTASLSQIREDFERAQIRQHGEFRGALDEALEQIQQQMGTGMNQIQAELRSGFAQELRQIRQRAALQPAMAALTAAAAGPEVELDWLLFAEKFRGPEESVRRRFERYVPVFTGLAPVVDLGCGRGEFLELLRSAGVPAIGVDSSAACVALCREKGLTAERADIFAYLEAEPDASLGGIFCAQVVEHLPPALVPRLVDLAAKKLTAGAPVVLETPNPACLAIFATHFYLDPTHVRPVPPPLMHFYLEEAGFGQIVVEEHEAAIESLPGLAAVPEEFRRAYFGGLDYSIRAVREPSFRSRS